MLPDRIKTQRLLLRPFLIQDVPDVLAYAGDLDYARYQSGPWPFRQHEAEAFVAELVARDRNIRPSWAITEDGVVSGIVVLSFDPGSSTAWLGYGLGKALWGKGYAQEAVRAVLACAFENVHQLEKSARAPTPATCARGACCRSSVSYLTRSCHRASSSEANASTPLGTASSARNGQPAAITNCA